MASLFTKCCCIGNCFWGWNSLGDLGDDYGYCSHNTSERLFLRIPRPGFAAKSIGSWPQSGGTCTCAGGYQLTNTATGASDIIVKYAHFPGESGSRLYNWKGYQPTQCIPPAKAHGTARTPLVRATSLPLDFLSFSETCATVRL